MGSEEFKFTFEYIHGSEEDLEQQSKHYETVFQAKTPGTLALEEVQAQVDLGQWKVRLGKRLVNLEARVNLVFPMMKMLTRNCRISLVGKMIIYRIQGPLNALPQS